MDMKTEEQRKLWKRNWKYYSEEVLIGELQKIDWQIEIDSVQEMWNIYENKIIIVVDRLAPLEEFRGTINRAKGFPQMKRNQN